MARTICRIFLLGLRGTGKSTVAPILADRLAWDWCDMDTELERLYQQSIQEMFANWGETLFRQRESALLQELCVREKLVVATGGGVVLREENRRLLKQSGWCVWLRASVPVMLARLQNDPRSVVQRPALTQLPPEEEIKLLAQQRQPWYEVCADISLDTDGLEPAAVADQIFLHLQELVPQHRAELPGRAD